MSTHISTVTTTGTTSVTLAPTGVTEDAVMFAVMSHYRFTPVSAAPSGWTLIDNGNLGDSGCACYYKVATASEPADYTWTFTGSDRQHGTILVYEGLAGTKQVHSEGGDDCADNSATLPSVTLTDAALVIAALGSNYNEFVSSNPTVPSGWTQRVDYVDPREGGTPYGGLYVCDKEFASSGATGDVTIPLGVTGNVWGFVVAFDLAAEEPPPPPPSGASRRITVSKRSRLVR
jgi:hypothetical protein